MLKYLNLVPRDLSGKTTMGFLKETKKNSKKKQGKQRKWQLGAWNYDGNERKVKRKTENQGKPRKMKVGSMGLWWKTAKT